MSNQNEQTILVEKHYIPLSIYQQIYGNHPINSQPSVNLSGTGQRPSATHPGSINNNQGANTATIRTTRRTTFSSLNPTTNSTAQHNNLDDLLLNGRNTGATTRPTAGIRIETIDSGSDESEASLFNALFAALINPSRLGSANSNQDRLNGLTANQIEDNSTIITYNNQSEDNPSADNQPNSSICSVCTLEYETGQQVRCLDACDHAFHTGCIDRWLADHNTCPLCRSSVMPQRTNSNTTGNSGTQPSTSRIRTTARVDLNGLD